MRILQYNILDGCLDSKERLGNLCAFIKSGNYDVVGLNELNGWDQSPGIADHAKASGFEYSEVFSTKKSKHLIGVMSKYPIEVLKKDETDMHHALLYIKTGGIRFLLTHLSPHDAIFRQNETRILGELINSSDEASMLMGDLNTLSPLDNKRYEETNLQEWLMTTEALGKKYLNEDNSINYTPMQMLLDAGLSDTGAETEAHFSVKTKLVKDPNHGNKMRIDYCLANQALQKKNPVAKIIHNQDTDFISDHYPIECEWED